MLMKRLILSVFVVSIFSFFSCGPAVPTKEIEDAKTSLERARSIDATVYAPQTFMDAETDYKDANKFVENKKNQEAKDKAVSSKTKAEQSYEEARTKRADTVYQKCFSLLESSEKNFAARLLPEKYTSAKQNTEKLKELYENKDADAVYSNGLPLSQELQEIQNFCAGEVEKTKNAIAQSQDKYDTAESKEAVRLYALEDLKKAIPLLEESRKNYESGDLSLSQSKAKEAQNMVDAAVKKAEAEYQKYLSRKGGTNQTIDLDSQKENEVQKQKAANYIEQAKERLEKLKTKKQSALPSFLHFSSDMNITNTNTTAPKTMDDKNITIDVVEKYIHQAEEAFQKQEYLDSADYAREAIRIADLLMAMENYQSYKVKLNPQNRDCFWKISGYMYDKTWLWPTIWRANKYQIQDPDLIFPGQELKIPPALTK